jgi:hypothetical protein
MGVFTSCPTANGIDCAGSPERQIINDIMHIELCRPGWDLLEGVPYWNREKNSEMKQAGYLRGINSA